MNRPSPPDAAVRPIAASVRSPLRPLQRRQAATTLSHSWRPPRDRGTTWSTVSAAPPQYAQRWASRRSTARRVTDVRRRYGTRTMRSRRMTDGSLKLKEGERTSRSYEEMTSTFPWHQSVTAFCQ